MVNIIWLYKCGNNLDKTCNFVDIGYLPLLIQQLVMAHERKKSIPKNHQEILLAIGKRIRELRIGKKIPIEKFCMENKLPRISYSNLEAGKNFQMTTLLAIIEAHPDVKSLADFFIDI